MADWNCLDFDITSEMETLFKSFSPHVDKRIFKEEGFGFIWLLVGSGIAMGLVSKGPFQKCLELGELHCQMIDEQMTAIEGGESKDIIPVEIINSQWFLTFTYLILGLWDHAARINKVCRYDKWDAPFLEALWAEIADSWGDILNGKTFLFLYSNLTVFLLNGSTVARPDQILSILQPSENIVAVSQIHAVRMVGNVSLLLVAALAAERLERDDLASFFAEKAEDIHLQSGVLAGCRAVRARVAQRRGDRHAAVALWQSGATQVLEARLPLFAVRLGQDCGGEEGQRILEEAAAALGSDPSEFEGLPGLMATCPL